MGTRRRNLVILGLVLLLTAASAYATTAKKTVLGLDLRGGTELVYQANPTAKNPNIDPSDMDRAIDILRERTDELGVSEPEIARIGVDQIEVGLPDVSNAERAIEQVGTTAQLFLYDYERNLLDRNPDLAPSQQEYGRIYDAVAATAEREAECFEGLCTSQGPRYYLFDEQTLEILAGPAEAEEDLFLDSADGTQPEGTEILEVPQGTVVLQSPSPPDDPATEVDEATSSPTEYVVLKDRPELSGDEIEDPKQQTDQGGSPNVTFDFTDQGRESFQKVTRRIAQRGAAQAPPGECSRPEGGDQFSDSFAVVLDNEIVSRPIINFCENPDGIDGRTGAQISGLDTITEAQDLAKFLQIGALPVDLTLVSQSTVSATLGEQALDQGLKAGLAGLVLVLLFLLAYYRLLGVVAGLGLLVYAVFFLALIKIIPITLTLPGMAGLVLTIGVAADANVVIFERIKEEVRAGKSLASAIATGYRKGIATIIDANVITLITAFILFVLASAGVKGFAFTLGIGTIVSLFTAVLFTQAILGAFGRARFMRSPAALGASGDGEGWHFDFIGASRWFFSVSGIILLVGAFSFATKQLNLGIDFESGTRLTVALEEEASAEEVRTALTRGGVDGADSAEIQETNSTEGADFGENVLQIQAKIPPDQVGVAQEALDAEFGLTGGDQGFDSQSIGPTFGEQVARSAVVAIIFSLLVICAYVAIRFEGKYAVPVLIALVHDILITAGVYALVGQEVTSATVAAFLTILGYSMYDTIIVLDRIRENVPRMPRAAFSQIVNRSMNEVLTRSLITGLSTVFLIGVLLVFGGETLRDFAFAMMVGVASGTYSSILIASPVLAHWKEREPAYRSRRARIIEAMGYVPTFPEQNVVAKIDEAERHSLATGGTLPPGAAAPPSEVGGGAGVANDEAPVERATPPTPGAGAATGPARDSQGSERPLATTAEEGRSEAGSEKEAAREARRKRRQQKRRKHGRPR
ncbi:MAG: protein translocase subunit SecD [Solirubrobacterales bacterium]